MKNLKTYLLEGYEGRYWRGEKIGPYSTQNILNLEKSISYRSDRVDDWIKSYFDMVQYDKINSTIGQQRFLYYFKEYLGNTRGDQPNDVKFRLKDIKTINDRVKSVTHKKLDQWKDILKNQLYDESDKPTDSIELFYYYMDNNVPKKYEQYKEYAAKIIKFTPAKYSGGDKGPYIYRRYFSKNNLYKNGMTLYTYVVWCSDAFYVLFITDDKFNVLYDWEDKIQVEQLPYDAATNIEIASDAEVNKFIKAFTPTIIKHNVNKYGPVTSMMMPPELSHNEYEALSDLCPIPNVDFRPPFIRK